MNLKFHRVEIQRLDWTALDRRRDRTIFQTREWLQFLEQTQHASPVIAELRDGTAPCGYFTGSMIRRLGVRILGSSMRGWTTSYMGFNLDPGVPPRAALQALERFAFDDLKCMHIELLDSNLTVEDGLQLGYRYSPVQTYMSDLTLEEDALFSAMSSACRRCIRKAEKTGVRIVEAGDSTFAAEYYSQLREVFARQGLRPPYDLRRVEALIRNLLPTGRLLLLRALSPDNLCIATGIFPAFNTTAYFWGNASRTETRHYRPNELIHWYAMRYWKARGIVVYDWGGGGDYKSKYGGNPAEIPWFRKSRYAFLELLRGSAAQMMWWKQRATGWMATQGRLPATARATHE